MIDARTTVLDAKMVKLDKKNKRIMIDKMSYVPFDILIISVGLIDTLLQN
jgi:NADH dehydrogenase FAD-containing subunit